MGKRRITVRGLLRMLDDFGEEFFVMSRKGVYRQFHNPKSKSLDEYFPYSVENSINKLVRKGWIEVLENQQGKKVIITENGRKQVLMFDLENLKPKKEKWDGKWRMVFFDIGEMLHGKRDILRKYLKKLGLMQMQQSVWISPYEIRNEIKYLREVLNIGDEVKWGILSEVENDEDLRKWFGL